MPFDTGPFKKRRSGRPNIPKRTIREPPSATSAHEREGFFPSQLGHSGIQEHRNTNLLPQQVLVTAYPKSAPQTKAI